MGLIDRIAKRSAKSKHGKFIENIRYGWNNYSFVFYIGSISAILAGLFGIAGWLSIVITIAFLYYAGKIKKAIDVEKVKEEKKKAENREHKKKKG